MESICNELQKEDYELEQQEDPPETPNWYTDEWLTDKEWEELFGDNNFSEFEGFKSGWRS